MHVVLLCGSVYEMLTMNEAVKYRRIRVDGLIYAIIEACLNFGAPIDANRKKLTN